MKRLKYITEKILMILFIQLLVINCDNNTSAQRRDPSPDPVPVKKKSIKLAILLDTSNSMDGLIEQAKSQLWTIVNEMAKAKCGQDMPDLHIALYEYGNDNLPSSEGYIRMVTPLTTDLDKISADLFALRTNGGQEFCGHVISSALKQLDWSECNGDYQVIFIAGNEPFTQGGIDYRQACEEAKQKGVIVNTIFCGNFDEGINTQWKRGADLTGGNYFSIEQNRKTVYIETPYDKKIAELNYKLNSTYIYYGSTGVQRKEMQAVQDENAASYGTANVVNRAVSKSSRVYNNKSWDLVDASGEKDFDIENIPSSELPEEMQNMSKAEKEKYIEEKNQEREQIKVEINVLNQKRSEYITSQKKNEATEDMLDEAIISSVKKQASLKKFSFN